MVAGDEGPVPMPASVTSVSTQETFRTVHFIQHLTKTITVIINKWS